MSTSTQAFLRDLIDYAGMFPPAELPVDKALRQFRTALLSDWGWIVGRFVVGAHRLEDLQPFIPDFSPSLPLRCAVVGIQAASHSDSLANLAKDLETISRWQMRYDGTSRIDRLEVSLPPKANQTAVIIDTIATCIGGSPIEVFVERDLPSMTPQWDASTLELLDGLAEYNAHHGTRFGFKLRMGGTTPGAFPPPERVAAILSASRNRRLPLKFTAGLHHPFRTEHGGQGMAMHGFVNLFFAAMAAYSHPVDCTVLTEILYDMDSRHFEFRPVDIAWKHISLTARAIGEIRSAYVRSFGSCSLDEPINDLTQLQVLRRNAEVRDGLHSRRTSS